MASVHTNAPTSFLSLTNPKPNLNQPHLHNLISFSNFTKPLSHPRLSISPRNKRNLAAKSAVEGDQDVIPVQCSDAADQQEGVAVSRVEGGVGFETELASQVGGFGLSFEGGSELGFGSGSSVGDGEASRSDDQRHDRPRRRKLRSHEVAHDRS